MSACLLTEVKWQWSTLVLGCVTASVHFACLRFVLALVDRNPFWSCFSCMADPFTRDKILSAMQPFFKQDQSLQIPKFKIAHLIATVELYYECLIS